jgi:hypothetical protein
MKAERDKDSKKLLSVKEAGWFCSDSYIRKLY